MTTSIKLERGENTIDEIAQHLPDAPMSPYVGTAAIALQFAMKYCDINTVQDGTLYQQYKLEGRNMTGLHLDHVFEIAAQIERHLLQTSDRIAKIVFDQIEADITEFAAEGEPINDEETNQ